MPLYVPTYTPSLIRNIFTLSKHQQCTDLDHMFRRPESVLVSLGVSPHHDMEQLTVAPHHP